LKQPSGNREVGNSEKRKVKRSWRGSNPGSLENEPGKVGSQGKSIADQNSFSGVVETEPGGTFHAPMLLGGVAAFGITLSPHAQLPGIGIDLGIASQADTAIRQGKANGEGIAEGVVRSSKRAGSIRGSDRGKSDRDIRKGLVGALVAAQPLGGLAMIIVTVAGEAITERAKRIAKRVIAAFDTSKRQVITVMVAQANSAQCMQFVVNKGEYLVMAFSGIAQEFTDRESGEAAAQDVETRDGE
jgi:hypothetical protein